MTTTRSTQKILGIMVAAIRSVGERIGAKLELHYLGQGSLAALVVERRPVAIGGPQAAALPAGIGIVDAAIEALGEEAHGIGDAQLDEFSVQENVERIRIVSGGDRHVLAQAERVVLIDPGVIARFGAAGFGLADAFELRPRQAIERPALGAVLAGRGRAVEDFALAPVE